MPTSNKNRRTPPGPRNLLPPSRGGPGSAAGGVPGRGGPLRHGRRRMARHLRPGLRAVALRRRLRHPHRRRADRRPHRHRGTVRRGPDQLVHARHDQQPVDVRPRPAALRQVHPGPAHRPGPGRPGHQPADPGRPEARLRRPHPRPGRPGHQPRPRPRPPERPGPRRGHRSRRPSARRSPRAPRRRRPGRRPGNRCAAARRGRERRRS